MHVYLLPISDVECVPEAFRAAHFPMREHRAKKYLQRADMLRCIGAGYLLWTILGVDERMLTTNAYGKPGLINAGAHFNISHSGDYVALCVDACEVGIDIEAVQGVDTDLAKYIFTADERAESDVRIPDVFYTLWTLKEAAVKLLGCGLEIAPSSFSVLPLLQNMPIALGGRCIYGKNIRIRGHIVSVCSEHPISTIEPRILSIAEPTRLSDI